MTRTLELYEQLESVAQYFGTRLRPFNLWLPDEERPLDKLAHFKTDEGLSAECSTNGRIVLVDVRVPSAFVASAGLKSDLIDTRMYVGTIGGVPIYGRGDGQLPPHYWLSQLHNRLLLRNLALGPREQLLVSRDRVGATLTRDNLRSLTLLERLNILLKIADSVSRHRPTDSDLDPRVLALPPKLHTLEAALPDWARWAISDDHDREVEISEASDADLRQLVHAIMPRLGIIDEYLDAAEDEFTGLDAIARAAKEARQELQARGALVEDDEVRQ